MYNYNAYTVHVMQSLNHDKTIVTLSIHNTWLEILQK